MRKKNVLWFTVGMLSTSSIAVADDFQVDTPDIQKGQWSAESNMSYGLDGKADKNPDNYFSHIDGVNYGLSDMWELGASAEIEKDSGGPQKLTNVRLESKFIPYKAGTQWLDWGFTMEMDKAVSSDKPNNLEAKLLLQKNVGKWNSTANLILSRQFGPYQNGSPSGGMALISRYEVSDKIAPGIEYYGDYGHLNHLHTYTQQGHLAGPVIQGQLGPVAYDTGILFGLSHNTPDTTLKLNLEYDF